MTNQATVARCADCGERDVEGVYIFDREEHRYSVAVIDGEIQRDVDTAGTFIETVARTVACSDCGRDVELIGEWDLDA